MPTSKAVPIEVTFLLLLSFGTASHAQGWVYLGGAHVDGQADRDKIKVGRSEGRFRALHIRVDHAAIAFRHIVIHYANGADEEINVRQRIRGGGSTRVINLRGRGRAIESIEIWYERANYGSREPRVRLYGR